MKGDRDDALNSAKVKEYTQYRSKKTELTKGYVNIPFQVYNYHTRVS